MGLDVKTLYLINVAVLFLSAFAASYFWAQYRDNAWLLWWTLGTAACGVALLVLGLFGPAPRLVVGFPTVVLLFAGNVMLWHSLRLFNGRAASIAGVVLIVLAFAALLATSIALGASLRERAGIASAGLAIFAALSAWEVSRDRDREFLRTRLAMAAAFGVMALVLVLRGALTWLAPESAEAGDYYDPLQGASSLINSISVVSLSIGLIMMANERTSGRHRRLALTDELTGLPNRRFFLAQAARLAQRAARRRAPTSVLMMDLDHFAQVNREFGHAGGDQALAVFAAELRRVLQAQDLVARYGGEEFCALLVDTTAAAATAVAERIRAGLSERPVELQGRPHSLTVSIGVAPVRGVEVAAALQAADEALYRAQGGRPQPGGRRAAGGRLDDRQEEHAGPLAAAQQV